MLHKSLDGKHIWEVKTAPYRRGAQHIFIDGDEQSVCGKYTEAPITVTLPGDGGRICRVCALRLRWRGFI